MAKSASVGLAAVLLLGLAGTSLANDLLATEQFTGTIVAFQPQRTYANMTLRVTGPNDYQASAVYPSGSPAIDLSRFGTVYDGVYNYHLTGTSGETVLAQRPQRRPSGKCDVALSAQGRVEGRLVPRPGRCDREPHHDRTQAHALRRRR